MEFLKCLGLVVLIGLVVTGVTAFVIFGLSGCNPAGSENDTNPEQTHREIIIDDCEYIFVSRRPFSAEMALTHKGNCTNQAGHLVNTNKEY
tara:strand:- start:1345 stop:1617 length:273 start_codon:yes stop_codon:yes gene_type:complete